MGACEGKPLVLDFMAPPADPRLVRCAQPLALCTREFLGTSMDTKTAPTHQSIIAHPPSCLASSQAQPDQVVQLSCPQHHQQQRSSAAASLGHKVVVIGSCGVGKSSLTQRFASNVFNHEHQPTLAAVFFQRALCVDGCDVMLHLWDTSGDERRVEW